MLINVVNLPILKTDFSVQLSCSAVSDYLRPYGPQHTRSPCPSLTPGVYWNSRPLRRWCHVTILSCHPLFFLPSTFPALGSFQMSQCFTSGGQSIGVSASASFPSNEYSGLISFSINWLDLLAVQGTLKSLLQHYTSKASIPQHSSFFIVQLPHSYMTTGKTIVLTRWTFLGKVMSLLYNIMSRLVINFFQRASVF